MASTDRADPFARCAAPLLRSVAAPGATVVLDAVCVSADIAGFSPLSGALGRHGPEGTEQLAGLLRAFFAPAIADFDRCGGQVAAFAGDALTVVFPDREESPDALDRAREAGAALLAHAQALAGYDTLAEPVRLEARVGIARGALAVFAVGHDAQLRGSVLGPAVDEAVTVQGAVAPGELSVSAAHAIEWSGAPPVPTPPPRSTAPLARFVPPVVAEHLLAGHAHLIDEHRPISAVFLGLPPGAGLADVHRLTPSLLEVLDHYDGVLVDVDCTDKGAVLFALFGAPTAHGDDETRAVACAIDVQAEVGVPLRVGVSTGRCFVGLIGSEVRSTYTALGETVNLAARLMGRATPGELVASESVADRTTAAFRWSSPTAVPVKGWDAPVPVSTWQGVARRRPDERGKHPLVGRARETSRLDTMARALAAGRSRAVWIVGPAGVGKTRLLEEGARRARAHASRVVTASFDVTATRSSHAGIRPMWRELLGGTPARVRATLEQVEAGLGDLAPLLGPLVGFDLPPTARVAGLDPAEREDARRAAVSRVLEARARAAPLLLVIDNGHWADPASRSFLGHLVRRARDTRVGFLFGSRPGRAPVTDDARALLDELALDPLDPEACLELARQLVGGDPRRAAQLARRSGGNALFLHELARRGDVGGPLPVDLAGLLHETVDRLPVPEQNALGVASVLGQRFQRADLVGGFGERYGVDALAASLDRLEELGLTPRDDDRAGYVFRSDSLAEVTYETLAISTRRDLHDAAGAWFESRHGDDATQLDLIAHHYGRSANVPKQRTFFARAARYAVQIYANESAIEHYERLLPLLAPEELGGPLTELGAVYEHVGRWAEADARLRRAIDLDPQHPEPRALTTLGRLTASASSLPTAVALIERGYDEAMARDEAQAALEALDALALFAGQHVDQATAEQWARRQLALAEQLDDPAGRAAALGNLAAVSAETGDLEGAFALLTQAHDLAAAVGPSRLRWELENQLFASCEELGDFSAAWDWLRQARETARSIGYEPGLLQTLSNEASMLLLVGALGPAASEAEQVLRLALTAGDRRAVVVAVGIIAAAWLEQGDARAALTLARPAREIATEVGDEFFVAELDLLRARAHLHGGDLDDAIRALDAARAHAEDVNLDARDRAAILHASIAARSGRSTPAEAVAALRRLAADVTRPRERAVIEHEIACLLPDDAQQRARAIDVLAAAYAEAPYHDLWRRHRELASVELPIRTSDVLGALPGDGAPLPDPDRVVHLVRQGPGAVAGGR